jgi:bifunctional non-homologous end joining protein LigD
MGKRITGAVAPKDQPNETAVVAAVAITHSAKVWWPEQGITKVDVARYYDAVAPRLLPFLKKRPLTAERCPEGMKGECFFQKNFSEELPPGVPTQAIPAGSTGEPVHYVIGGAKKTLLALVNLGCIAVHVMNCQTGNLDHPDWLAFDLDPASGKFAEAAKAAKMLRQLLSEYRLRSYPKTTGGKGLHVLVPLRRGPDQARVREFARALGREMAERSPSLVTVQMAKSKRRGRVFVDWLRNGFGQTIAAPYSVRRRPQAPISTPLEWDEVDPRLDPSRFNLLTIERRFRAKNPWADFWSHRQTLPDLKAAIQEKT